LQSYIKNYVENPKYEYELQKDDNIKNEIKTIEFQRALVGILIQRYIFGNFSKPEEVKNSKKEWIGENAGDLIVKFKEDYEITNNPLDFVRSQEIEDWIKHKDLRISMKKLANELKFHLNLAKLENVYNKVKKVNGKSIMVWFGIKRIIEDDEFEEETTISNITRQEKVEIKMK
jgi:hypothetical protein